MTRRTHLGLTAAAVALLVGGVGCGESGPKQYRVSGNVTFDGKPVKKGYITFEPDAEKGNTGPGGGAEIQDGAFSTPKGKGVVGGPYVVKIVGYDGVPATQSGEELPDGKPLFPIYQTTADFPQEDVTKDFTVPLKPPPSKKPAGVSGDGL